MWILCYRIWVKECVYGHYEWVEQVCGLLEYKQAVLPVRYLEISLGANPHLVKTWKPVIDKVEEKLSLWKAKVLNKAGKLVLIKSVLNSLLVYYLSLYKMSKAVTDKLIALQRSGKWFKHLKRLGVGGRGCSAQEHSVAV
ncbi:uncharacterized protein LOC107459017 [Arachis duranensis]|uniref:Uncharacterized protein LOC107459017 n=1 Tax=Arachis duranensis TaxID=130453 RepID=A0A6P4B5X9_ARADU|nr:uncharacterized protein LOC107459017 [Arachis duranensis]